MNMSDLEQLPDHHGFQDGADASRSHHEGVGSQDEVVQTGEEGAMLKRLLDEGIDFLLEGQIDANADGSIPLRRPGGRGALVGGLHEAGAAPRDDVAAQLGQGGASKVEWAETRSQKVRRRSTRRPGGLPAMMAELTPPMEMPTSQVGVTPASARPS